MNRRRLLTGLAGLGITGGSAWVALNGLSEDDGLPKRVETIRARGSTDGTMQVPVPDTVTVIDLFATWCTPCKKQMTALTKLHEEYGGNVRFVFITNERIGGTLTKVGRPLGGGEIRRKLDPGLDPSSSVTAALNAGDSRSSASRHRTERSRGRITAWRASTRSHANRGGRKGMSASTLLPTIAFAASAGIATFFAPGVSAASRLHRLLPATAGRREGFVGTAARYRCRSRRTRHTGRGRTRRLRGGAGTHPISHVVRTHRGRRPPRRRSPRRRGKTADGSRPAPGTPGIDDRVRPLRRRVRVSRRRAVSHRSSSASSPRR